MIDPNATATPVEISDSQLAKMLSGETAETPIAAEPEKPVEKEASSDAAKTAVEKPAAGPDPANPQEPNEPEEKLTRGLKKRFKDLTDEIGGLKQRLAEKEKPAAAGGNPGVASPVPGKDEADKARPVLPDLETFKGTYPEYQAAHAKAISDLIAYELKQGKKADAEAAERQTVEQRHKDQAKAWNEAEAAVMKRADRNDYEEVADSVKLPETSPASGAIAQAIQQAGNGPELLYHLGKNPALVEKLTAMAPLAAVLELGQIAASLVTPAPKTKVPDVPLPKPPVIPSGGAASAEVDFNDPNLSQEAFNREMEKTEKRRGRR